MIDLSEKCFMMIEPVSSKKEIEINDKISNLVEEIMKNTKIVGRTKGWHTCNCGERSGSTILEIKINNKIYITNSLALHYVKYHRSEIPQAEIDKLIK